MYISDLILLIIVILFIFRAALKKRRNAKENNGVQLPDKTGGIRRPLSGTTPAEAPQDACRGIKVLSYYYDSLPFKDFKVSPASPRTGAARPDVVKAKVLKASGMKALQKGDIKAFVVRFKSGHVDVAQRQGPPRLPIKTLYSNSIPKMLGNEKRVFKVVKPNINKNLQENIDKQVRKILEA